MMSIIYITFSFYGIFSSFLSTEKLSLPPYLLTSVSDDEEIFLRCLIVSVRDRVFNSY